jgi:UDP-N-acetylglucosamine--N-acetylmuramyl-(pentapeptide) pyrophosphoryl-undecaprenol N-acetylglucosamine transferase
MPFITRMEMAYAAADVVISRAGAIAISELSSTGKPAILIPLPTAAEDHQAKNAESLVSNDAAIHLKDSEAKEKLGLALIELMKNEELRERFSQNIRKLARSNSAGIIANDVLKLLEKDRNA